MGRKCKKSGGAGAGLASEFDAWIQSIVACLPRDDHAALVMALASEPQIGVAMWAVEINMPPAVSQTPVNILELARILAAERCLRALSKHWASQAAPKVTHVLANAMSEFEAGAPDAERCMRALWCGLRDRALMNPRAPYFGAAINPRAPKATRSLLAYAAAQGFDGGDHFPAAVKAAHALVRRAELAIAEGDAAPFGEALIDLVRHADASETNEVNVEVAAGIVACAIGCQRFELAHMALIKGMRLARPPLLAWEAVLSIAKTVQPLFRAADSPAQAGIGLAFTAAFGRSLAEAPTDALDMASARCRVELSSMTPCMLDGVASARARND